MLQVRILTRIFLAISCLSFCIAAASQANEMQKENIPVFRKVSYPFLPSLSSAYFFFSEDGLMWFSSERGLTSFDGTEATYYCTYEESIRLGLNKIDFMAEDALHNFYIVTRYNLIYFNKKERKFYSLKHFFNEYDDQNLGFRTVYVDKDGKVYLGAYARGLFIYNPNSGKVIHVNIHPGKPEYWKDRNYNTISCIEKHATNDSMLWIGTFNGIYQFDKSKNILERKFIVTTPQYRSDGTERSYYDVQKMEVADDSTIWFNMWSGGFCRYDTRSGKTKIYLQDDWIIKGKPSPLFVTPSFVNISKGIYMVGINQGKSCLINYRHDRIQIQSFNITPDQKSLDAVFFCEKDKQGNVWILRNSQLYTSIPTFSRLQSLEIVDNSEKKLPYHNEMRGVYFDQQTKRYYFSVRFSDRIYVVDTGFNSFQSIPGISCDKYGYKTCGTDRITKDGSGRFWATGFKTHVKLPFERKFVIVEKVFPKLSWINKKGQIHDAITTRDGNILLRSNHVIYHINHLTLAVDTLQCPAMVIYNSRFEYSPLQYDSSRNYIYLSNAGGIGQFQLHKKVWRVIPNKIIFGNEEMNGRVLKFTLDEKGRICLLIDLYGIRILDPETFDCVDSIRFGQKGLLSGLYTDIIGGGAGYLVLQGTHGIVLYHYERNLSFLFDHNNGLSNYLSYSFLYSNGHFFVGQADHIEYFNISDFLKNRFSFKPIINSFRVDSIEYIEEIIKKGEIKLPYKRNNLSLSFSTLEFVFPERVEYAYQLTGIDENWNYSNYFIRKINYNNLVPGHYVFKIRSQQFGGNWDVKAQEFGITINPPFWGTRWFQVVSLLTVIGLIYLIIHWRLKSIRQHEREINKQEKELLELEARALRAQMNPHFIFNCMNSIKALIQNDDKQKSIDYLTTFSKLIRTLFNNSDKRQVSLFDELETCRLYTQLEAMRLDGKLQYEFNIDDNLDLKSVMVPALIVQPFIENAIWHGIVPKEQGKVWIKVDGNEEEITCVIDDDGIGRELSKRNKPATPVAHQSKGINLSQARLDLEKILSDKNASVEIIDKYEKNKTRGTKVIIRFNLQ